ncbi:MAG: hypothetical protein V3V15_04010 [Sphingorhabdus sp.]
MKFKKIAAIAAAGAASLSLSGCLILPGDFTSEMTVMRSGEFSFSYKGEIQLLGLATLLGNDLESEADTAEFEATCWTSPEDGQDETEKEAEEKKEKKLSAARAKGAKNAAALGRIRTRGTGTAASSSAEEDYDLLNQDKEKKEAREAEGSATDAAEEGAEAAAEAAVEAAVEAVEEDFEIEERECTADETAEQKKEWDTRRDRKSKVKEEQQKMFSMLLGGIDPKDPKTIARFTKEVERLAAWHKVKHLGDGKFTVDYSTKGMLADDFAFPIIPRYAIGEPMIHITRWDNGRLRIEAPSFHNDPDFSMMAMFGAGSMLGMGRSSKAPEPLEINGTFTLTTDARILANNTEEGPADTEGGLQLLTWEIGPKTFGPPMALLRFN